MKRIPIEILRIRNTPIRIVRSDGITVGIFNEGIFISDRVQVERLLKEVKNGGETLDTVSDSEGGSVHGEGGEGGDGSPGIRP